jgi:hypothetical protein
VQERGTSRTSAQGRELSIVERRRVNGPFALCCTGRLLPEEALRQRILQITAKPSGFKYHPRHHGRMSARHKTREAQHSADRPHTFARAALKSDGSCMDFSAFTMQKPSASSQVTVALHLQPKF